MEELALAPQTIATSSIPAQQKLPLGEHLIKYGNRKIAYGYALGVTRTTIYTTPKDRIFFIEVITLAGQNGVSASQDFIARINQEQIMDGVSGVAVPVNLYQHFPVFLKLMPTDTLSIESFHASSGGFLGAVGYEIDISLIKDFI